MRPHLPAARRGTAILLGSVLLLVARPSAAQQEVLGRHERHPLHWFALSHTATERTMASTSFDATYYHLQLGIDFAEQRIAGTTRVEGSFAASASELGLDLLSNLVVTAVRTAAGDSLSFDHSGDVLVVDLGRSVPPGEHVSVDIDYGGQPQSTGFGAFAFSTRDGQPAAWTLSEPYGARAWWPGKDHPSDKVDSARVTVTVPVGLRVGSNGTLATVVEADSTVTYDWVVHYPIAPYLLSVAAGSYAAFEQTYVRPDSLADTLGPFTMPVLHYRYTSGGTATLPAGWAEVVDALAVFEWWFGPYPFGVEKYGHAQFGWGGGMEHQTMSSMGGTSVGLVTHELAHQWFGDAVTTRTWPHLWLNEGFASYAEILYWETMRDRYAGVAESAVRVDQNSARQAQGTLVVQDTLDERNLFAGSRVYAKGSAVLHMLRYVIGDEPFREMLHAYIVDPALAYGTAVTADLQRVAEAVSGSDLDAFFRQWVTEGTGYPHYEVTASHRPAPPGGYDVDVAIRQTQTPAESNVGTFVMPVTLAVDTAEGEQRFVVENTRREQTFTLHVAGLPTAVRFDPDYRLLSNEDVFVDLHPGLLPTTLSFDVSPNPSDGPLRISGGVPDTGTLRIDLVDPLGRHVRTLSERTTPAGPFLVDTRVDGLAAGVYFVSVQSEGRIKTRSVVILP